MYESLSDNELIKLVISDDRKAFTKLYTLHINNIYRYIFSICGSKETSEEIIQNVFLMVWKNRAQLEHVISFKSYIYRCAKNALLNQIKKNQTEAKIIKMWQPESESSANNSAENSDGKIIYRQHYQMAQDAINLLPEKRKQIFELSTKEELSLGEIAVKLSISKSVVKKQLYLGRNFIKEYLQKTGVLEIGLIPFIHFYLFVR